MLKLNGLHLLLTYKCTFECDHCFVWGSPSQSGSMTLTNLRTILEEAKRLPSLEWIYFEGGEPTLFYPQMLEGVRQAHQAGFHVGVVSNVYWANSLEDALLWLKPLAGLIEDLSVSSDLYHYNAWLSQQADFAIQAARQLDIPVGVISIAQPAVEGQNPEHENASTLMYRGRAAQKLAVNAPTQPWKKFTTCPYEDLHQPGRLHVDAFGNLHICQGISIGNLFADHLDEICAHYDPMRHPVVAPLLENGPVGLVEKYNLTHHQAYADACHLCDHARQQLRDRFPHILTPDQMYAISS